MHKYLMVKGNYHFPPEIYTKMAQLIEYGLTRNQICDYFGLDRKIFKRSFEQFFGAAVSRSIAQVAKTALDMAKSGEHPEMTMFWLKSQAGWRDKDPPINQKTQITITKKPSNAAYDFSKLTDEELATYEKLQNKVRPRMGTIIEGESEKVT